MKKKKAPSSRKSKVPNLARTFGQSTDSSAGSKPSPPCNHCSTLRQKESRWAVQVIRLSELGRVGQVYGKVVTGRAKPQLQVGRPSPYPKIWTCLSLLPEAPSRLMCLSGMLRPLWGLPVFITWDSQLATSNIISICEQLNKTRIFCRASVTVMSHWWLITGYPSYLSSKIKRERMIMLWLPIASLQLSALCYWYEQGFAF